jgi:acetate kinase
MDGDVLVVNAGSSSLKVKLPRLGRSVTVERLGSGATARDESGPLDLPGVTTHTQALAFALGRLGEGPGHVVPDVVGHRIVHGGTVYRSPTLVDDAVEADVARLARLAPLHNPANLEALRAARAMLPQAVHVAVFDTAFHADLPRHAYLYGLPLEYALEQGLRRYGFHGTSHDYVTRRAAELLGRPLADLKIVSLHLGNGASAAAVSGGTSVDTSMGFTPLEGLLMGTRCGDIDPGLVMHLLRSKGVDELDELLNRGSGLKGVSGVSHDMRDVRAAAAAGNDAAAAALELFTYRVRKLIGSYAAAMGGLDAVVFTGGIGENDAATRRESVRDLRFLGIELDDARNEAGSCVISVANGAVSVLVVNTDEEALIAADARAVASRSQRESAA